MLYGRDRLAAVVYRHQQLARRQARLLLPVEIACQLGLQPLRGQWHGWRRLIRRLVRASARANQRFKTAVSQLSLSGTAERTQRKRSQQPVVSGVPIRRLAVGLVTFNNEAAQLQSCLRALEVAIYTLGTTCHVSVFVLDNGESSDVALRGWSGIQRLVSAGNIGFGAGHNRLMQQAFSEGAEAYIAMNPDGRAHPKLLESLIHSSMRWGHAALVEALQFPCEHPKPFNDRDGQTPWASGACLLIPKGIYELTGGFDTTFFMYCEDVDLSWRARAAGFHVVTAPEALFLHQVSNRTPNPRSHALMLAAGVQLGYKWRNPKFTLTAQLHLCRLGSFKSALPEQAKVRPKRVARCDVWASTFSHAFSFSRPRW